MWKTVVRFTLWFWLLVWMLSTTLASVLLARRAYLLGPNLFGTDSWGLFLSHWLVPFWIVFTTLMLIWASARFTLKFFGRRDDRAQ
jgi:hypothetical protein